MLPELSMMNMMEGGGESVPVWTRTESVQIGICESSQIASDGILITPDRDLGHWLNPTLQIGPAWEIPANANTADSICAPRIM
jgi:hypothetical protein